MRKRKHIDEFAWLVGYLDGEGCFGARLANKAWYPRIQAVSIDLDLITKAATILGCKVHGPKTRTSGGHLGKQPYYIIYCDGKKAKNWMTRLLPFMSIRRQTKIRQVLNTC